MSQPDALPKPPRGCGSGEFYCDYLPQLWRAVAPADGWPDWQFEVEIAMLGDDSPEPEHFVLRFDAGRIDGRAGRGDGPVATLELDQTSFRLAVFDTLPRILRKLNRKLDDIRRQFVRVLNDLPPGLTPERLTRQPGRLVHGHTDDAGDRAEFRWRIGSGQGPQVTVEGTDDDLWSLLDRGGIYALLRNNLVIEGDVAYLL